MRRSTFSMNSLPSVARSVLSLLSRRNRVAEIKDLTQLSAFGVGSIMNTRLLTARPDADRREVLKAVKGETKSAELLYYVYFIDEEEHLKGL